MGRSRLSVEDARATLETLSAATHAADPKFLAPSSWITRFHTVVRTIVPRDQHYQYRLVGINGITMGTLHRAVEALRDDFDGLVEDKSRRQKAR